IGDDALMSDVTERLFQHARIDALDRAAALASELFDFARARIVARVGELHSDHALGMSREHRAHGMHAVNGLDVLHASSSASAGSVARSRSIRPSIGLTDVTMTRTCAPVPSRRRVRRPTHACPPSSIMYWSSRRLSMWSSPSTDTSSSCTKQ